jgi:auxin influx carrier (AUX1 LAX family)
MFPGEQAEDAIVADVAIPNGKEGEARGGAMGVEGGVGDQDQEEQHGGKFTMKSLLWHGGSVWDAWFSCASNQVNTFVR